MKIISQPVFLNEVDSTNNYANNLIKSNYKDLNSISGKVIVCDYQTGGRGQQGNIWESEKSKNLLFSLILIPDFLKVEQQFILSKLISISLIDCLKNFNIDAKIKWANDIYVGNKKIAGILIENVISGNTLKSSVIGIGLNVNQTKFSEKLPNPTSISQINNKIYDIKIILNKLLDEIFNNYSKLIKKEFDYFDKKYLENLYLLNTESLFKHQNSLINGKITGINKYGQLEIIENNNRKIEVNFKEVEFILK